MADENIGFFKQVWRWLTFWKLRKSLGLARAADRQFTQSAQGIEDAGTVRLMALQNRAKEFFSALSGLENAIELKKTELKNLRDSKATLLKKRNGAAVVIETQTKVLEKLKKDNASEEAIAEVQAKIDQAKADGRSFSEQIKKITGSGTPEDPGEEKKLSDLIAVEQKKLIPLETQLKALNKEIKELPVKTKEKAARFLSNQQMIEAYNRMNNLNSPLEADPMEAVDKMLEQQDAQVRTAGRITANTTDTSGQEYLDAGSQEAGADDFDNFLKARDADKKAKSGESATPAATEDRPKI